MDDNNHIPEDGSQNPIPPSATSPPEEDDIYPEDGDYSAGEDGGENAPQDSEHTRKVGQTRRRAPVVDRRVIWHEKTFHRRNFLITCIIRVLQIIGTFILIGALTGSLFGCYVLAYIRDDILPRAKVDLGVYTMKENSIIYYYDNLGQPVQMQTLQSSENREYVAYEDIPQDLINAVVAIEDKRFWEHQGVDWYRTMGAFVNMFLSMRNTFGASTLTQQTIKNFTEYDDVTVTRKILEIFTAIQAERDYTKEYILERYLNKIYLGNGCYGVQAASKYYFGKDVKDLDLSECASLAGITNNPSLYSPYGVVHVTRYRCNECGTMNNDPEKPCTGCGEIDYGPGEEWTNRDYNLRRRDLILQEMYQPTDDDEDPTIFDQIRELIFGKDDLQPYITEEEYEQALAEKLIFTADDEYVAPDESIDQVDNPNEGTKYSWYEEAVISEAIDLLKGLNGMDEDYNRQLVFSGGLKIYCAYDPYVQSCIDQIYNDPESLTIASARTGQKLQSNMTIVDNSTGMVVAMGTTFPKLVDRGWNYPVDTVRQPGSSIKPVSVYGPALELGLITPASISDDNPHYIGSVGNQFLPTNAPLGYNGLMSIMDGVKVSKNTISINTLEMVTPEKSFEFMTQRFHFTSLVEYYETSYGQVLSDVQISPLAMGGLTYGVSTHEMAAAFATFPRMGSYRPASTIYKIEDINGRTIIDNTNSTQYILKESTAYYMNEMLTNVVEGTGGATGTAAKIAGQTVAGKTGTTNSKKDLWFCGYTNYYTGAVWVGYDNPEEIVYTGAAPATVMWQKVMAILHEGLTNSHFSTPGNLKDVQICMDCGKLATENCALDMRGNRVQTFRLVNGDAPTEYCNCHVLIDVCTESPIAGTNDYHLAGPNCPAESVKRIAMVDRPREIVSGVYVADWDRFLSVYDRFTDEEKYCDVHTAPPEPDPTEEPDPDASGEPGEVGDEPGTEPTGEPGQEPTQEPTAEPTQEPPAPTEAPSGEDGELHNTLD